ncbi:hexokinase [Treponema sp.]
MRSSFNPRLLAEFAFYHGFHYRSCDPAGLVKDLAVEMERGLRGDKASLPMLPSYINSNLSVPAGKTVLALDAGGTNLRAARVRFDEKGKAIAEDTRKAPMPGTRGRLGATAFFDEIADLVAPLLTEGPPVEGIGFCFSYQMQMTKDADGILIVFSKEVDAPEVIGKLVGASLREALARRGIKAPERIVLLNDTTATLLTGLVEIPADGGLRRGKDSYGVEAGPTIGFILGTGMNIAYPETRIPKIGFENNEAPQIVVCESGSYHTRYTGRLDLEFDATLKNPGQYTYEKMIAGAYLGPLSLFMLKRAISDGVLVFRRSDELMQMEMLQTKDLNGFMHSPLTGEGPLAALFGPDERDALATLVSLVSLITQRAAMFSAAALAAAVERTAAGFDPFVPVRIAVEGTTYVIYKGMRMALESYLQTLLSAKAPRHLVISPVEQASLFGAAVAALNA